MLPPTSCSSTPQAHKRKWFRKSWASETRKCAALISVSLMPWRWGADNCCPQLLTVKVEWGRHVSSWEHELGLVPGTRRSLIFSLSAHYMLISTEETSFSFLPPKRRSQCWLPFLDRVTLPSWPLSRAASCPSLSWRNSFNKVLGPVWKSPSPCSPKQN